MVIKNLPRLEVAVPHHYSDTGTASALPVTMISRPSIACTSSASRCAILIAIAGLALQIAIGHVDATSFDMHSCRVNTRRYPFGLSSTACNTILKTIPRGGAKSITPLPPPVDEEAAAEAGRAASVKSAFDPDTLPSPDPQVEAAQAPPPTADHTKNLSAKLSNAWERTVPAVLMLAAATALLKFTGTAGLTVLIFALQIGMYHEATSVIEQFHINSDPGSLELRKMSLLDNIEKWWWFATVILGTSGRSVLVNSSSSGIGEAAMDLVVYGMAAIGLVVAVVGMEAHSRSGPLMFRNYLAGVAGCHFVLVSLSLSFCFFSLCFIYAMHVLASSVLPAVLSEVSKSIVAWVCWMNLYRYYLTGASRTYYNLMYLGYHTSTHILACSFLTPQQHTAVPSRSIIVLDQDSTGIRPTLGPISRPPRHR